MFLKDVVFENDEFWKVEGIADSMIPLKEIDANLYFTKNNFESVLVEKIRLNENHEIEFFVNGKWDGIINPTSAFLERVLA